MDAISFEYPPLSPHYHREEGTRGSTRLEWKEVFSPQKGITVWQWKHLNIFRILYDPEIHVTINIWKKVIWRCLHTEWSLEKRRLQIPEVHRERVPFGDLSSLGYHKEGAETGCHYQGVFATFLLPFQADVFFPGSRMNSSMPTT